MRKELISIAVSFFLAALMFYGFYVFQKEEIAAASNLERFNALSKLADISSDLEREIQSSIVYTDFFSIIISNDPNIEPSLLEMYSYLALKYNKNIKSVQFAPDAIIQIVYPKATNAAALGHDLLADPDRAVLTKKAIEKRTVVLQGPVLARQGGFLLFNRKAVFIEKDGLERFWGLVVIAIDFERLIAKYQDSLNDVNYLFALRSNNNKVQENLFGEFAIFQESSIIKSMSLPETTWELAIYPKSGWKDEKSIFNYFNGFYYFTCFIIFFLTYLTVKNYLDKIIRLKIDPLTETLNKNAIRDVVNKRLASKEGSFAFLVIDINDFKAINDSLGHYVGDCVLIEIASRLGSVLRDGDSLSRFGGDEYIVMLDNLKQENSLEAILKRMIEEVAEPIIIDNNSLHVSISIGFAMCPAEARSYNDLYQIADKKMYEHKKESKFNSENNK